MVTEALPKLAAGRGLGREEAREVMLTLMRGEAGDAQIGALLMGLRVKGESPEELAGFAEAMRESAVELRVENGPVADTCGTGGDGMGTFNISTAAAFIAAGAGLARRQARQPGGHLGLRQRRRPGSPGHQGGDGDRSWSRSASRTRAWASSTPPASIPPCAT